MDMYCTYTTPQVPLSSLHPNEWLQCNVDRPQNPLHMGDKKINRKESIGEFLR